MIQSESDFFRNNHRKQRRGEEWIFQPAILCCHYTSDCSLPSVEPPSYYWTLGNRLQPSLGLNVRHLMGRYALRLQSSNFDKYLVEGTTKEGRGIDELI